MITIVLWIGLAISLFLLAVIQAGQVVDSWVYVGHLPKRRVGLLTGLLVLFGLTLLLPHGLNLITSL